MKSKGFTLIELLAVIVILAIIALIATPVILGIINNVKDEANKRSIEMYAKAIENAIATNQLTSPDKIIGSFNTLDGKNLILTGQEEPSLIVDYDGNVVCDTIEIYEDGSIYLAGGEVDRKAVNYTYGKINIPDPVSFATDSWQTIAKAVKEGNTNKYKVGDTKEVSLTRFTNSAEKATFTVRIANKSSDDPVCNKEEYSKTACGFVIEFADIITQHNMNSTFTNTGGWKDSKMREYINNTIYNTFPEYLKNVITETNVVSGHGLSDTSNFITTDKLYLLSMKEVYGESSTTYYDEAETVTRQLDYYKDIVNVTVGSFFDAKKKLSGEYYSGSWGLRSAYSNNDSSFHYVGTNGMWYEGDATVSRYFGVAPAFRIG